MAIAVTIQSSGPQASVQVRGDLNGLTQDAFKSQMEPVLSNVAIGKIRLDFGGVNSIEPAGDRRLHRKDKATE